MMANPRNIIKINPKEIKWFSPVSLTLEERLGSAKEQGYPFDDSFFVLSGDWDLSALPLEERGEFIQGEDFLCGKAGKDYKPEYCNAEWDWANLSRSIRERGYVQDPGERYVEVAIGRDGEYFLTDGIHRVTLSILLGVKEILVEVVYIHSEYNFSNLSSIKDDIVPEFIYDLVVKKWPEDVVVYQTYEWMRERLILMGPYLHLFEGRRVLDLGCNAFLSLWTLSKYADEIVGIDYDARFIEQAKVTLDCFRDLVKNKKVSLKTLSVRNLVEEEIDYDFLFGYCIMYWLDDSDVERVRDKILPKCPVVFLSTRRLDNPAYRNARRFHVGENLKKFLEDEGFSVVLHKTEMMNFVVGQRDPDIKPKRRQYETQSVPEDTAVITAA